ncbi:hypothetical protein DRN72_00500 [Methanosarcinales archaeon]|nr:MAG: hypothetical protein DRN72_00500 [Methanosarcinales archaeon]
MQLEHLLKDIFPHTRPSFQKNIGTGILDACILFLSKTTNISVSIQNSLCLFQLISARITAEEISKRTEETKKLDELKIYQHTW